MSADGTELTDNQVARQHAKYDVVSIATALENLAGRLRKIANQLDDESQPAAAVIAEVVNDYTQGVAGNVGPVLRGLVRGLTSMT